MKWGKETGCCATPTFLASGSWCCLRAKLFSRGLSTGQRGKNSQVWSIPEHPKSRGQRGRFIDQEFLFNLPEYLPWTCSPNKMSKDCKCTISTFSHYLKTSFHIWGLKFACFVFILFSIHNILWPVRKKKKNPRWSRWPFFLKAFNIIDNYAFCLTLCYSRKSPVLTKKLKWHLRWGWGSVQSILSLCGIHLTCMSSFHFFTRI